MSGLIFYGHNLTNRFFCSNTLGLRSNLGKNGLSHVAILLILFSSLGMFCVFHFSSVVEPLNVWTVSVGIVFAGFCLLDYATLQNNVLIPLGFSINPNFLTICSLIDTCVVLASLLLRLDNFWWKK